MIINIPNNLPIPSTNKRSLPALPVGRDIELRVVEFFCFFWVAGGQIFCQEAPAGLGDCLLFVSFNCICKIIARFGFGNGFKGWKEGRKWYVRSGQVGVWLSTYFSRGKCICN